MRRYINFSRELLRPRVAFLLVMASVLAAAASPSEAEAPSPLQLGQSLRGRIAEGQSHTFSLTTSAEQYLRLRLEQKGVDLRLAVYGPRGKELKTADGPGGSWVEELLSLVVKPPGTYRLLVEAGPHAGAGEYLLTLEAQRSATPRDRFRLAAEALHARGRHLRQLPDEEGQLQAIATFERALFHWKEAQDLAGEAGTLDQIGGVYFQLGKPQQALQPLRQALTLYGDLGDLSGQADAHNDLGLVHVKLHKIQAAHTHYEEALKLWKQLEDPAGQAMTLTAVGNLNYSLGKVEAARQAFERALPLRRAAGDLAGEAVTLGNLGVLHQGLGNLQQARQTYERALAIARQTANRRRELIYLVNLGSLHQAEGEPERALDGYLEALEVSRELGDQRVEQKALAQLGAAYRDLGEPQRALEFFISARRLAQETAQHDAEAWSLIEIGWLYDGLKQLDEAAEYFHLALQANPAVGSRRTELYARGGLGRVYRQQGRTEEALEELERALHLSQDLRYPLGTVDTLRELGQAHLKLRQPAKAFDHLSRSLALNLGLEDPIREARIRADLARAHRDLGQLNEAFSEIERALEIDSTVRAGVSSPDLRISFHSGRYENHELYIDLLMTQHLKQPERGLDAKALWASERARAQGLVELLAEAGVEVQEGIPSELRQQAETVERRLSKIQGELIHKLSNEEPGKEKISSLRLALEKTRREREAIEGKIHRQYPRYAHVRYPRPLELLEIQGLLDHQTALLEYALGKERSYLFVVSRTELEVYPLPPADQIAQWVRQLRLATAQPSRRLYGRFQMAAKQLYEVLIEPAEEALAKVDRLLIVPDRELLYLPFEALLRNREGSLLERWSVGYAPSATVLASLGRRSGRQSLSSAPRTIGFLGFGEPLHTGEGSKAAPAEPSIEAPVHRSLITLLNEGRLQPLPESGHEVRSIANLFKPQDRLIYLGPSAREERVKENPWFESARRIHFATHGLLDDQDPAYTGLLLSSSAKSAEDGLLQMHEIFNLKISADLVVLSACETGVGKEVRGEGLLGLSRAFFYAGASSLVVSLWQVADESTAELMLRFYRHLEAGVEKIDALRAAKRELARQDRYSHPFHWAPFILIGQPDSK